MRRLWRLMMFVLVISTTLTANAAASERWQFPVPVEQYFNWYNGRSFYYDQVHLGEDVDLREGTAIRAIGDGVVVAYKADGFYLSNGQVGGFGELYAVIEHDLGQPYEFVDANGHSQFVRYIRSIYGHMRASQARGGPQLTWQQGDVVRAGDIIGYINDSSHPWDGVSPDHNGDGLEHLHMGILLNTNITSNLGYDYGNQVQAPHFTAPSAAISLLMAGVSVNEAWWHTDAFRQAHERNTYAVVGTPFDNGGGQYVHDWYGLWVQDFKRFDDPACQAPGACESAIIYNPDADAAYHVRDGFWCAYKGVDAATCNVTVEGDSSAIFGPLDLGAPTMDEQPLDDGSGSFQIFQHGRLEYRQHSQRITIQLGDFASQQSKKSTGSTWPCTHLENLSRAAHQAQYDGLLFDGDGDVCGAAGWSFSARGSITNGYYQCPDTGCMIIMDADASDGISQVTDVQMFTHNYFVFPVEADMVYQLTGRARSPQGSRDFQAALAAAQYLDATPTYERTAELLLSDVCQLQADDEWQSFACQLTTDASADEARLHFFTGLPVGKLELTDLSLVAVGPAEVVDEIAEVEAVVPEPVGPRLVLYDGPHGALIDFEWEIDEDGGIVGLTKPLQANRLKQIEIWRTNRRRYNLESATLPVSTVYRPIDEPFTIKVMQHNGAPKYLDFSQWQVIGGQCDEDVCWPE